MKSWTVCDECWSREDVQPVDLPDGGTVYLCRRHREAVARSEGDE